VGTSGDRNDQGFRVIRQLADPTATAELVDRAWEMVRRVDVADAVGVVVRFERDIPAGASPDQRISKLIRVHRQVRAFRLMFATPVLTSLLADCIGPDVDLFLSQIVFKLPGALGQPWHQDTALFPFEPPGPIIAVWCALTAPDAGTSRLRLQPGSHHGGLGPHGHDPALPTRGRYLALLDQTVQGKLLELEAGDAVVFDAGVVHASSDNNSVRPRLAATAHFAAASTIDRTEEVFGATPFNDWMPWLRGRQLEAPTRRDG